MKNQQSEYDRKLEAELQRILTGRLNQLCLERQWTLKQLAQKSNISLATLRKISQGKHCNINSETMLKLCRAFKVVPYELFGEKLLSRYRQEDKA